MYFDATSGSRGVTFSPVKLNKQRELCSLVGDVSCLSAFQLKFRFLFYVVCVSRSPVLIHGVQEIQTWERAQNPKWRLTGPRAASPSPSAVSCPSPSTAKRTSPLWIWTTTRRMLSPNRSSGTGFTTPQTPATLDPGRKGGPSWRPASSRRCLAGGTSTPT